MAKKKYLISVVPFIKIPLGREQFFYYSHSQKIPIGSLVEIPFGKKKIEGITINSKSDFKRVGNMEIKKIIKILEKNFLTDQQLKLIQFISDYYFCSLGIILKQIANKTSQKYKLTNREKNNCKKLSKIAKQKITLTPAQKIAINKITKNITPYTLSSAIYLLFGPASSGKTQVYFEAIKKLVLAKNSQAVIILPELTGIAQEIDRYSQEFNANKIAILHSKITPKQFYKNWQNIKSGQAQIIIGTRQAVFAPFKNLKIIIIDEAHDISHKQWELAPRYDARFTAEKLAKLHQAKLVLGSATPRVEDYYQSKLKYNLLKLFKIPSIKFQTLSTEIVDLRNEHYRNFKKVKKVSPISQKLEAEIKYNLKYQRQIILFINRQGMSSFTACLKCKEILLCPDCERALTYRQKGNYECLHCQFSAGDFPSCPHCQGMEFKNVGLGTEKIETEIEKLFPSAKIARADSSAMKTVRAQEKLWRNFSQGKIDILIGTQMIAKAWDLSNVGLVGIIDADSLFAFPDFHTDENAFANIKQAIGRTNRSNSKFSGQAIIQTYHPENEIIQLATTRSYEKFYQREIKERRILQYPPFTKIIKLIFQNYNQQIVSQETESVYKKIIADNKQSRSLKIYPPQEPLTPKLRGRYRQQIIIKYKPLRQTTENYPSIPKKLLKNIQALKSGWLIDIDPINIV